VLDKASKRGNNASLLATAREHQGGIGAF